MARILRRPSGFRADLEFSKLLCQKCSFLLFSAENCRIFQTFCHFYQYLLLHIEQISINMASMSLKTRVTTQDLEALRNREVTGRALAQKYGVTEFYFSHVFAGSKIGKIPGLLSTRKREKRQLRLIRNSFRDNLALQVSAGRLTAKEASKRAHCSLRTMYRHIASVKSGTTQTLPSF